ncbi:sensor histidine kinase [Phyllobacterium sp. 628]|uniref:sensor histidine kinase n=1 Tax=Phyllobacterium sp. 628 TaxID=2718938 RepID=UPI00166238C0|nr:sensor histidine kinase [Phyllobacterium sp. 628]QND51952.1 sensor histidine kinase [Phyllobacterium sp. 628]
MTRREPSLFARLARRISLVLGIGAALLVSAAWYYAETAADKAYDRLLVGAALQMAESLSVENGALSVRLPTSAFELLGLAERDRIFYRVIDTQGKTVTGYDDLQSPELTAGNRDALSITEGVYKGEEVRIARATRVLADPSVAGHAYVIVAQTNEARSALTRELTLRATILVLVMSLLAFGGAMLAIRYALQPVERLGAAVRRRDPHDLTPVSVDVPRELDPFVGSINHFMGRLNERVDLLQRFIADAAHQIRTPLTALSAQIDLLGQDKLDKAGRQHFERVQQRTGELARLTNQLLSHAMVIHRADSIQLEPISLVDVARRAYRAAIPITVDPDIVISFEAPDDRPFVLGDAVSLREAIVNVIDNALRHGTDQRLEVRVRSDAIDAYVEVEDDGPGIPPEGWEKATQRFATSKSHEGSSGLGFAIAQEVVNAHGGTLGFRARNERGFTVILTLPLYKGLAK